MHRYSNVRSSVLWKFSKGHTQSDERPDKGHNLHGEQKKKGTIIAKKRGTISVVVFTEKRMSKNGDMMFEVQNSRLNAILTVTSRNYSRFSKTFTPCVGSFTSPGMHTKYKGLMAFSVSTERWQSGVNRIVTKVPK